MIKLLYNMTNESGNAILHLWHLIHSQFQF